MIIDLQIQVIKSTHNLFGSSLHKQVAFLFNLDIDFSTLPVSEDLIPNLVFVKFRVLGWRSLLAI